MNAAAFCMNSGSCNNAAPSPSAAVSGLSGAGSGETLGGLGTNPAAIRNGAPPFGVRLDGTISVIGVDSVMGGLGGFVMIGVEGTGCRSGTLGVANGIGAGFDTSGTCTGGAGATGFRAAGTDSGGAGGGGGGACTGAGCAGTAYCGGIAAGGGGGAGGTGGGAYC